MKSIMEEASSISKAIEAAWNRAGQPTEFTVKILELPQTSFFGLKTSKSAKIAFLFNEATVSTKSREHSSSQRQPQQRPVALRQTSNRNEQDQRRRPDFQKNGSYQERAERPEGTRADRPDRNEQREPREQREQRPDRDRSPRSGSSEGWKRAPHTEGTDKRQEKSEHGQRSDYRSRTGISGSSAHSEEHPSDASRRTSDRPDYAKPLDLRSGVNASSARPEEHHSDVSRRTSDRREDRRPRFSEDRSEHGYSQERDSWTPEMAQIAQEWIKETLVLMGKPGISVSTQVSQNYLKVNLSNPVSEDMRQEETQLKSWGMLAMEAVREKIGKPLRALRIVLESPRK